MQQRWHELLFAHWSFPPETVRPLLPAGLELDTFDGLAWVGVIPFHMSGVRLRAAPPLPTTRAFAELNVRTYVRHGNRAGVWFFSLDAESTLAVIGARLGARLPYYRASMSIDCISAWIHYGSARVSGDTPAEFSAKYRPRPAALPVTPGSLASFLTDRYCLFSGDGHRLWQVSIVHPPWTLYEAEAVIDRNSMLEAAGLPAPSARPVLHFATFQDVRFWWPERVK